MSVNTQLLCPHWRGMGLMCSLWPQREWEVCGPQIVKASQESRQAADWAQAGCRGLWGGGCGNGTRHQVWLISPGALRCHLSPQLGGSSPSNLEALQFQQGKRIFFFN